MAVLSHHVIVMRERLWLRTAQQMKYLLSIDPSLFELGVGVVMVITGILFLWPGDSAYVTTPGWSTLRIFFSETQAGLGVFTTGLMTSIGVLLNIRRLRLFANSIALLVLMFVAISFFAFSPFGTWIVYAFTAVTMFWSIVHLRR